ncbi:unnamed protein product [Effrenium voratum]|uniref:Uncharacterized protein n=1 Tax=Effrenium voratum TaxID=2562239 RepID=A0AA36NBT5_9DINO|nr:unnamed protein product [Effrenium voratum]CAJ1433734.1 unnamed protein product [Effrenium voratum]
MSRGSPSTTSHELVWTMEPGHFCFGPAGPVKNSPTIASLRSLLWHFGPRRNETEQVLDIDPAEAKKLCSKGGRRFAWALVVAKRSFGALSRGSGAKASWSRVRRL